MVNTNLFKFIMRENDDTMDNLAAALGISRTALSHKINNKNEFKLNEICEIAERYNLSIGEVDRMFNLRTKRSA